MLYTSRIKLSTNPFKEKWKKIKHTKIKNELVSDAKHKNWTLGKIVFLQKKEEEENLENPNQNWTI